MPASRPALAAGSLLAALFHLTALPTPADAAAPAADRTWHVSVRGDDGASGSPRAPLRSVTRAVSRARSGDHVVVHGGSYHESVTIPAGKAVHVRRAAGARVWLDGSRPVRGWRRTAGGFAAPWRVELDASPTYTWGAPDNDQDGWSFVNPARPMAAHPDQVWIGGARQRQVGRLADLRPGTFFVDDAGDRLHVGSNPTGRQVRASALAKAFSIRAAGASVTGINVRRFAPSVPHMGAVTAEAPGISLRRMRILASSTTGLHVSAPRVRVRGIKLARNGMLGMSATYADRLVVRDTVARRNNTEGFNTSPVAGGAKIGRSRHVVVSRSSFVRNAGTGLWFDESTYDVAVLDTTTRDNAKHGLSIELATKAVVADTVVAGNAGHGVKINNSSRVELWNNTVVRNGRAVNIVQDDRDATDRSTPGHNPRRPHPDPTMSWVNRNIRVHNNVLGAGRHGGNCLLCVEDYSGRWTAEELRIRANGNVYQRPRGTAARWAVVWSRGARDPAVFTSVRGFRSATGREARHLDLVRASAVRPSLRLVRSVARRQASVAIGLAARPARKLGRPAGVRHLGAWPGRSAGR